MVIVYPDRLKSNLAFYSGVALNNIQSAFDNSLLPTTQLQRSKEHTPLQRL
jgi:hypothetical protein